MNYRIAIGALALLAGHSAHAMGMKCDHPPTFVYAFTYWDGGCNKAGLRDGDGIELYEHKLSGNRLARRVIYYGGHQGEVKFEIYTWYANGNYIIKQTESNGGVGVKPAELPAWAKFVTGPKGRTPTAEEVEAVRKFRQSAPAWNK